MRRILTRTFRVLKARRLGSRRSAIAAMALGCLAPLVLAPSALAQAPPLDLWTAPVMQKVKDRSTLGLQVVSQGTYFDVFYNSEVGDAKWADSGPPYEVHTGDTIRIHGYLAFPTSGPGPYPAIVVGHGHGGSGSPDLARAIAAFGYVALSIDGPRAGLSTGGPEDTEQAWISVEEVMNVPAPEVSYLYHYTYAGMRGITALDQLSRVSGNPFRIAAGQYGVLGASMGGQLTYYVNGVDDRVKAAVAVAVAGDWHNLLYYEGAWLYHGLYHHTRDGLQSGLDDLNTISDICDDPTAHTFLSHFDPAAYAPTQHGPLLTIIGTHDQYFTIPAINTTYDKVASAGTSPLFAKRLLITPNGKHGVIDNDSVLKTILSVMGSADRWLKYAFANGAAPPETPTVRMSVIGDRLLFRATAVPGTASIQRVDLHWATQLDTTVPTACDFSSIRMIRFGGEHIAFLPIGSQPSCGPAVSTGNILFYASARDEEGYTISSKMYHKGAEMEFCTDFAPVIEHFPGDDFPVPPPPSPNCVCPVPLER
jgi:cephalosporin-C deacetylase-like acetyl esterase